MKASACPPAAMIEAHSEVAVGTGEREEDQADGEHERPGDDERFRAEPGDQPRGEHDHRDHDEHGHRQQRGAGGERAVAEDLLEVEVEEVPHRHPRGPEEQLGEVRAGQVGRLEDAQAHQRCLDRALDGHEHGQQHKRGAQHEQCGRRAPALLWGAHDAEHDERQAGGHGQRAEHVDAAAPGGRRRHQRRDGGQRGQSDRDVEPEHPGPAQPLGDHAAEEHSGGTAGGGGRAVERDGLGQFLGLVAEEHDQQRQGRRRDQRGTDALDGATVDLDAGGPGERAEHRADEQDDPSEGEHPLGSEEVRETSAEQQQAAEGDQEAVEHPRQAGLAESQILLHPGQRHGDDRGVHDDHELGKCDEPQGGPAPGTGDRHEGLLSAGPP